MRNIIFLLCSFALFFGTPAWASVPREVTIGFIPGEGPATVQNHAKQLASRLQQMLHVPIKVLVTENYAGLIEAMKKDQVQFAFFSAATFVFAEKQAGAKVLMKKVWEEPFYYSVLISPSQRKIHDLKSMKGKKIVFVDEKSASGFLYPQVMLKQKQIDPAQYFGQVVFSGNHAKSVAMLESGEADVAAVFSDDAKGERSAWQKFATNPQKNKVRVVWSSEAIPTDPLCVRLGFYDRFPRFTHDLMFALIELSDAEGGENIIRQTLGASSLQLATSRQYDPVREMVKSLKLGLD